jgi:hypothetical protein
MVHGRASNSIKAKSAHSTGAATAAWLLQRDWTWQLGLGRTVRLARSAAAASRRVARGLGQVRHGGSPATGDGFVTAIERSGRRVAEHFPAEPENPHALPDGLTESPRI